MIQINEGTFPPALALSGMERNLTLRNFVEINCFTYKCVIAINLNVPQQTST